MPYSDEIFVRYNPFQGDRDITIECRKVRIVTIRKEQPCAAAHLSYEPMDTQDHMIPAGSRAWKETAKAEGQFGSCYCCLPCLARLMDQEAAIRNA